MSPDEFIRSLSAGALAPVYLFIGPETWSRERCRQALIERVLPPEDRDQGFTRYDLDEVNLDVIIDDAKSLSLFASNRVIWAGSAEAVLPRGRASTATDAEDEGRGGKPDGATPLEAYVRDPVPGVVLVFDSRRHDFERDDKAKLQRVQKFFGAARQVEFVNFTLEQARKLAQTAARERQLAIGEEELDLVVEALGPDPLRITTELEKLALYAGSDRPVTAEDISQLIPNAKAATIFSLVNAIAKNDRTGSLESLDILVREGEYLPLALSFLGSQFRQAVVAKEARLTTANQVQAFFAKQGIPMWRSRAEQVAQTASASSLPRLKDAVCSIYKADKALRDMRPDDRTVMEQLVMGLTEA